MGSAAAAKAVERCRDAGADASVYERIGLDNMIGEDERWRKRKEMTDNGRDGHDSWMTSATGFRRDTPPFGGGNAKSRLKRRTGFQGLDRGRRWRSVEECGKWRRREDGESPLLLPFSSASPKYDFIMSVTTICTV